MWLIKTVFIFFLGLLVVKRILDIGDTEEKRDFKTEVLYIVEVIVAISGIVLLFKV